MLKENKDITIKHLEDTIIFLIRTLHKEIYHTCMYSKMTAISYNFKHNNINDIQPKDIILYYLHNYLGYIVTLEHKIYVDGLNYISNKSPETVFNFIIPSNIISYNNNQLSIEIPYEDTLNKLYNDIEGSILDKYIAKLIPEKGKE